MRRIHSDDWERERALDRDSEREPSFARAQRRPFRNATEQRERSFELLTNRFGNRSGS
jgi:hypothetical protein